MEILVSTMEILVSTMEILVSTMEILLPISAWSYPQRETNNSFSILTAKQ